MGHGDDAVVMIRVPSKPVPPVDGNATDCARAGAHGSSRRTGAASGFGWRMLRGPAEGANKVAERQSNGAFRTSRRDGAKTKGAPDRDARTAVSYLRRDAMVFC